MKLQRALITTSLACLAGGVSAQQFVPIVDQSPLAYCTDITPDGDVVVGNGFDGGFYWRWRTSPTKVTIGGEVAAVSADGNTIAGTINGEAGIWRLGSGWQNIGSLPGAPSGCGGGTSTAYDISADGSTIVGLSWANGACLGRAFRWTEAGGIEELEVLGNDRNRASAISDDGTLIGGFAQGNSGRTPAVWYADGTGDIWDIDQPGEVYEIDGYGTAVVGTWGGDAFFGPPAGAVTTITDENFATGQATDFSENGDTVVGFSLNSEAWVQNAADGLNPLQPYLQALGVPNVPFLQIVTAVSDDGTVIAGHTFFDQAWIVELPEVCGWTQYSIAASPGNSMILEGSGSSSIGTDFFLTTSGAAGAATGTFVSFGSSAIPFLSGVVLFSPVSVLNQVLVAPTTGGTSVLPLPIPMDFSLVGASVYFQSITEDFSNPSQFAWSNGVKLNICQ